MVCATIAIKWTVPYLVAITPTTYGTTLTTLTTLSHDRLTFVRQVLAHSNSNVFFEQAEYDE